MNEYRLFIDNVEYKNANLPFKFGEYLDKELDHAIDHIKWFWKAWKN